MLLSSCCFWGVISILFVEAYGDRHMLVLHHTQKPIKQVEIGIRLCGCKNNQGHVYIGHSRPDKFVFPWQYTLDIAYVLFIIEDCYVDDIAYQRLYLLFLKVPFALHS